MGRMAKKVDKGSAHRTRVLWTETHDDCLIRLMLEHTSKGNRVGTAFKKHAWVDMVQRFNSEMHLNYEVENLKNRLKVWRREYNTYKSLLMHKGFVWDNVNKLLVAPTEEWEDVIKNNAEAAKLRFKPCPRFKDLQVICKNLPATDHDACSSQNQGNDLEELNTSDGSNDGDSQGIPNLADEKQPTPIGTAGTSFTAQHYEADEAVKDVSTSNVPKKLLPSSPANARPGDKAFRRQRNEAISAMKTIAEAFSQRTILMREKLATSQFYTLQKCMEELNRMDGLEQAMRMKACMAFEKEFNRHMFLLLRPEDRLDWLRIICGDKEP